MRKAWNVETGTVLIEAPDNVSILSARKGADQITPFHDFRAVWPPFTRDLLTLKNGAAKEARSTRGMLTYRIQPRETVIIDINKTEGERLTATNGQIKSTFL